MACEGCSLVIKLWSPISKRSILSWQSVSQSRRRETIRRSGWSLLLGSPRCRVAHYLTWLGVTVTWLDLTWLDFPWWWGTCVQLDLTCWLTWLDFWWPETWLEVLDLTRPYVGGTSITARRSATVSGPAVGYLVTNGRIDREPAGNGINSPRSAIKRGAV